MKNSTIKAVILAAGKGTRMKSSLPKVLQTIFQKTLLEYVIDAVKRTEKVDEFFVIVGHQAEDVEKYTLEHCENTKCVLQSPQRGTGDAAAKVVPYLENFDGNVLIICGDTPLITSETLNKFFDAHITNNNDLTVVSAKFDDPTGYGRIVRGTDNKLSAIVEQKDADENTLKINEINAGIYLLNWAAVKDSFAQLKNNNAQNEYYLTDIVRWSVDKNLKVDVFLIDNNEEIFGINSKKQLAQAGKILNQRKLDELMAEGVTIVDENTTFVSPDTTIGADTIVYPNTFINGKNVIGKNCKIGPNAHIRDGAIIGDNVRIGNFVEVKKSEIKSNTNVSHLSYIGDASLGSGVNIGAGTITANYNSISKVKSKTIIEDGVSIGSNTVLVAPVTMGKNSLTGAGTIITKDIPENALGLTRAPLKILADWYLKAKQLVSKEK